MSNKITVPGLIDMRQRDEKIVMLTASDYTFAALMEHAGVDVVLVGDSLGMTVQGNKTTLPVTLDEMLYHCRIVTRAVHRALVIGDMPFMSYQLGPEDALRAAGQFVKNGGVAGVKLEGGSLIADTVKTIVQAGIPVMGHIGLTPQSCHVMGGYKVQGKTTAAAHQLLEDAIALQEAGAFSIVLEGIPAECAGKITDALAIPTIGIGAGVHCSGQVLVLHDMLGLVAPGSKKLPKFVKQYADLGNEVMRAVENFASDVREAKFPTCDHSY